MSSVHRGRVPPVRVARTPLLAVLSVALVAGGCGHDSEPYSQANWYAGGPRPQAAAVPIPVEMEDDGHPAQLPPRAEIARAPDDPSEPWSPNYGSHTAAATDRKWQAVVQPAPADPVPAPRRAAENTWQTMVQPASAQVAMVSEE